jgi:cell division septal protein FtsQ
MPVAPANGCRMGSSRASTPAGRKRASRRAAVRTGASRNGARRSPAKAAPRRTAKKPAPRKPPARKPATKRKAPARKPALNAGRASRAPRIAITVALVLALAAGGYQLWFRNSSFVAVDDVAVTGMEAPERAAVTNALTRAAKEMTTLNVDEDALHAAVAGFPTVVGVEAEADFPHRLSLTVRERPPVVLAKDGDRVMPVAGDGTILAGVDVSGMTLPEIAVTELPSQGTIEGEPLEIARIMGAAPEPLRELVEDVSYGQPEGVQVTLRGDVPVYFGGGQQARDKWAAAAAVLANAKIDTLTYVDVRVADRPAVGGAAPAVAETTTSTADPATDATIIP